MIDAKLATRLYGPPDPAWKPYLVFGRRDQGPLGTVGRLVVSHWPGTAGHGADDRMPITWPIHGYRGLLVQDYRKSVTEQPVKLCWAGVDIDAPDNPDRDLPGEVSDLLFNQCLIRTSKSGKGVHCIVVFYRAIECAYHTALETAKRAVHGIEEELAEAGIKSCVAGLPNLWLWSDGGLQRTVSDTGVTVSAPTQIAAAPVPRFEPQPVDRSAFSGLALEVLLRLSEARMIRLPYTGRTNVNIGRVKRVLDGVCTINTRSKCRAEHESEVNGFLEITADGTIKLVSNADNNSVVLALHSL